MTRPERSARIKKLKALYRKERCGLAECVGNEWATAEEQKTAVCGILSGIESELRRLGVSLR